MIAARHFSSRPSDSTLRWRPCRSEDSKQRLQVRLGCIQLSLWCQLSGLDGGMSSGKSASRQEIKH